MCIYNLLPKKQPCLAYKWKFFIGGSLQHPPADPSFVGETAVILQHSPGDISLCLKAKTKTDTKTASHLHLLKITSGFFYHQTFCNALAAASPGRSLAAASG